MNQTFDHRALWMKAKLFLNHAMDPGQGREFDERALWASLALELLAKAALSRVSPMLIADPVSDDGKSIMAASGLFDTEAQVVTVKAKAAITRCSRAFKPFSAIEASKIFAHRNEYLHGGSPRFTPIPESAFWPRFWAQAVILVEALDEDIDSLVGSDRVATIERHLSQNKRNLDERYESRIARARQRITLLKSGNLTASVASELAAWGRNDAGLKYSIANECPACGSIEGIREGEDEIDSHEHVERVDDDDYDVWYELTIGAERFSCARCHLVLEDIDMLERAGMETTFEVTASPGDYYEPEYNNE